MGPGHSQAGLESARMAALNTFLQRTDTRQKLCSVSRFGFCVLPLICLPALAVRAQSACDVFDAPTPATLTYPANSRAAHVQGQVILLLRLATDGKVLQATPVSGPSLLAQPTAQYATHWSAVSFSGPRECPVVVSFALTGPADRECGPNEEQAAKSPLVQRIDPQHVSVSAENSCLSFTHDPSGKHVHRIHF